MDTRHRSPARILAPLALIVFALALLVILSSGAGSGHSTPSSSSTKAEQRDLKLKQQRAGARTTPAPTQVTQTVYVVRTGDTRAGIAQKTGVPIEKLQTLNPNLDPQGLLSGQRIKLR
jgi:LysM repeat protein